MSLSRRQFFRQWQFWNTEERSAHQRQARYIELENDARRYFLPYDFTLTPEQDAELFRELRAVLEPMSLDDLNAPTIMPIVQEIVEEKLEPWRNASARLEQGERIREVRQCAPDYVKSFITLQATPQAIDQLKIHLGVDDMEALENALRRKIEAWLPEVEDHVIAQYDILTIKELVFAQLRSWC
jgi:hypothetical protein